MQSNLSIDPYPFQNWFIFHFDPLKECSDFQNSYVNREILNPLLSSKVYQKRRNTCKDQREKTVAAPELESNHSSTPATPFQNRIEISCQ